MGLPKDDCSADSIKKRVVAEDADLKPFRGESFQKLYTYIPFRTIMASLLGSHVPSLPPRNLPRKNKKVSVHLRNFFTHEFAGGATGRWREAARGATQEEKLPRQTALLNLGVPEGKSLRW